MDRILDYYIVAGCLLLWIGTSAWALIWTRRRWRALFFSPVEATIGDLRLVEESTITSSDGPDSHFVNVLHCKYQFTLDGKNYTGTDEGGSWAFPDGSLLGKKGGKPLYKGNKRVGDKITVYYNPQNPSENTHHRYAFFGGLVTISLTQLFLLLAIHLINKW